MSENKRDEEMETLTLEDVAGYLQKDIETVRRNVRSGKIPGGIKVGGSWRVHKETFRRFLKGEVAREDTKLVVIPLATYCRRCGAYRKRTQGVDALYFQHLAVRCLG